MDVLKRVYLSSMDLTACGSVKSAIDTGAPTAELRHHGETDMDLGEYFTNIHTDFHTPALQRDIAVDFDPDEYGRQLAKSHVNSVTFFAKGHHGNSYYETKVGRKHPHLQRNLLKEVVEACHRQDVRVLAYYSFVWDDGVGEIYPDWVQKSTEGFTLTAQEMRSSERGAGFGWICLNSPYPHEVVWPQVREIAALGVDGFFFDALTYFPTACVCHNCLREMQNRRMDPDCPGDVERLLFETGLNAAEATTGLIRDIDPGLIVTYKGNEAAGYTPKIAKHCDYIWCEFPGPYRGVAGRYFPSNDVLWQGMGGCAYHTGWSGWGLPKDERRLTYEMACNLSYGGMISTGFQPMPRLALDRQLYDTIGAAFGFATERKEYILGARPLADIAVLASESSKHLRYNAPSLLGATIALAEHHFLFDIIDSSLVDNFERYKVVVIPDGQPLDPALAAPLDSFVEGGGKLIAAGAAAMYGGTCAMECLGLRYHGLSPYSAAYFATPDALADGIKQPFMSAEGRMAQVVPEAARVLSGSMVPTTERALEPVYRGYAHEYAPPENESPYPSITENEYGAGAALFVAVPIFQAYESGHYHGHATLIANMLRRYLGQECTIETDAPRNVEITMLSKDGRDVISLLHHPGGIAHGMSQITGAQPVRDILLRVRAAQSPTKVMIQPQGVEPEWSWRESEGRVEIHVEEVDIHELVVIVPGSTGAKAGSAKEG